MMSTITNSILRTLLAAVILFTGLASTTGVAAADGGDLAITVADVTVGDCGEISFYFEWENGSGDDLYFMDFGNGDTTEIVETSESSITIPYTYLVEGDYQWSFQINDVIVTEILSLAGPEVLLSSSPFPPLFVVGDAGDVDFTTTATGGSLPYTYAWDLDGDGVFEGETGDMASFAYTEVGKYYPQVLVTDSCGFTGTDSIPVVVANPEDACHPTAQKIADGVNTIFPNQANDLYTCEDVYALFENESEENNLGFGRMWKAYHLAESMEELTWEDILDWHLNESGWGSLLQLDRFADLLEDHDLPELMGLVMSDEYSLGDVRTAVRSVTRYEADFEDALARILEGATTGELGQFYKLAADLEADVEVLDAYLADGLTLAELKHTSKFADRMEADWTEVADARSLADSWGDINQAYHLATDEVSAAEILSIGVQDYKELLREEDKAAKEDQKEAQTEAKTQNTADKLAEQFSAEFGEVMNLFNGECAGEWSCVRSALKDQKRELAEGFTEKDIQTAQQIGFKYGFTEDEVLAYHKDYCDADWVCTRAYFRELYMSSRETGKAKK